MQGERYNMPSSIHPFMHKRLLIKPDWVYFFKPKCISAKDLWARLGGMTAPTEEQSVLKEDRQA